ncbi:MAG: hypothetical protein AUI47_00215 [Acidobacteria bacterium 13_1_40CM_2_68_5]|nr:MAG: hypothetical protein AUI47_00215 [Acidobacteria bacterium 13_1_40CM_2_68_5]
MDPSFEAGRTAPADTLALELATAPLAFLEGALANPVMQPDLVSILLKNHAVTGQLIVRISARREWLKAYEVKAAIVLHPKTPRAVAMNLVQFLWWRDLAKVADDTLLAPPLRRAAERILSLRIQELALGEKIALARIASRGVIHVLTKQEHPMVIRALLQNPRLVEEDALVIASARGTPSGVLQTLAEDARFSKRPSVQKALVQNHATPAATALRIVQGLGAQTLKELARAPHVPTLVKVAVQRILDDREHPQGGSSPASGI